MLENLDVKIPQHVEGNAAENSLGGTELETMELFRRLPEEYIDKFHWIVSRPTKIRMGKDTLYWIHDLPSDPMYNILKGDHDNSELFKKLIFVSHWQMQMFNKALRIPFQHSVVLKNAIVPIERHEKKNDGKLNLIYASTPQRGLDVLLVALDMIERDDWHLDVYSSFKIYGWPQNDAAYEKLFNMCKQHENITYHGFQPYDVVREAYKKAHILSYPCTWEETSCRVAMEAMSAGCAIVVPNLGALPETCADFAYMYQYNEEKIDHAAIFADVLEDVMDDYGSANMKKNLDMQIDYSYNNYSWDKRIDQWIELLDKLIYDSSSKHHP